MASLMKKKPKLDINQLAHRIVREATDDDFKCPTCGEVMEKRTESRSSGRFGSSQRDIRHSQTYYVCPNGHEVRVS
jgi:transcription initiation factor IIE alpha subunit